MRKRRSPAILRLRSSICSVRMSSPFIYRGSKAQRTARALVAWPQMRSSTASPLSSQAIASPSITQDRIVNSSIDSREAIRKVVPIAGEEPNYSPSPVARIRKPSYLILRIRRGPAGGSLVASGREGSEGQGTDSRGSGAVTRAQRLWRMAEHTGGKATVVFHGARWLAAALGCRALGRIEEPRDWRRAQVMHTACRRAKRVRWASPLTECQCF